MSEDKAEYTATPGEAFKSELISLRAAAPTLRVRLNFALMAKGNVQPEVTIEVGGIPADDPVTNAVLADIGYVGARVLKIATFLGKRWEWHQKHVFPPLPSDNPEQSVEEWERGLEIMDRAAMLADREEIEGWLVERASSPPPASGS